MTAYLVADIGGTHARCAMARVDAADGSIALQKTRLYHCRDFASVDRLLMAYCDELGEPLPAHGCVAVAGPVSGDRITLTNNDWNFSIEQLRRRFNFERLSVINDLAAVACSTRFLGVDDLLVIKPGRRRPNQPCVVIGVGTGLGVAGLLTVDGRRQPVASEAGHTGFAPGDKKDLDLLRVLQRRHGHVSWEMLLSGAGLARLYEALAILSGRHVEALPPIEITRRALSKDDALCVETVVVFCAALARFASDAALAFCALGGVYFSGDICRSLQPFLNDDFVERFSQKGAMTEMLSGVPVSLIRAEQPGLIGAAANVHSLVDDVGVSAI